MPAQFSQHGLLPNGIHECVFDEVDRRFGGFQQADRRPRLWSNFREFFHELKVARIGVALFINGSFVTGRPDPNDIDLILVLPANWDFNMDLPQSVYNLLAKK